MSKNFDSRQTEHRSELKRLSDQAKPTLKQILPQINAELTPVFELRASDTPDLTVNIGAGDIVNTDTGLTRSFSPIDGQYFKYNGGTVVFPAANGGTITIAGGIDSTLVMADDTFMAVLLQINSIGEVSVSQGVAVAVEADTLLAANFPVPNGGELPIGYVVLQNVGGAVQVIENEKIVQFESGGGGSGSGDAVGFESEMDDYLDDSFFEYYAPIIFPRDKEDFINDANSTGDFKNADGIYQLEIGQIFESTNLFDTEFIARNIKSLQKDLVVDYFDDASRDDGATYEVSIDGGVTYEPVTMERQTGTTRYLGRILLSDNATFNDLRVRITASEAETKLENIAIFYNEGINSIVGGTINSQTFVISGDDDVTGFTLTKFLPDPQLVKMYVEETGQTFKGSALSINGYVVTVPTGTFDAPGETFTISIDQTEGTTFDNNEINANKIANLEASLRDFGKANFEDSIEANALEVANSDIVNRAAVPAGLVTSFGSERVIFEAPSILPGESGSNGETVYSVGDERVRLAGNWRQTANNFGTYINNPDGQNDTDSFIEFRIYGTGLNILLAGTITRDFAITVDGVPQPNLALNLNDVLGNRNYATNNKVEVVSGLTRGWHTIKIKNSGVISAAFGMDLYGYDILNEDTQIETLTGSGFAGLLRQTLPNNLKYDYKPAGMGSIGGRVVQYILNGEIGSVFTPADGEQEVFRSIDIREFGKNRADDHSTTTTGNTDRAFVLDDNLTALVANNTSISGETVGGDGSFQMILTYAGTGVAIEGNANTVTDNLTIGDVFTDEVASGSWQRKRDRQVLASGLGYGTHTARLVNGGVGPFGGTFSKFLILQPKKPTLPAGAVEIADYNVVADYSFESSAGRATVSQGVIRTHASREILYSGSWTMTAVQPDRFGGFGPFTSTNGAYFEYSFFGEGADLRLQTFSNRSTDVDITLNGTPLTSANFPGVVVNASSGDIGINLTNGKIDINSPGVVEGANISFSNLPLAKYTVRCTSNTAAVLNIDGIDVITPIHINSSFTVGSQSLIGNKNYQAKLKDSKSDSLMGQAKAWIVYDSVDNIILSSYNIAATLDVGTGRTAVYFEVPFEGFYSVNVTSAAGENRVFAIPAKTSTPPEPHGFVMEAANSSGGDLDQRYITAVCYGKLVNEE